MEENSIKSVCKACKKELPDKRYKFCGEVCKGLYKLDTSTNAEQGIVTGPEQDKASTGQPEALQSKCPDCGEPLSCLACVDNLLITTLEQAQVPASTELSDWQTRLDQLPAGIPHPATVPDGSLGDAHERQLRQGMKKGDWVSTQAYAEQIRRYLYWTEAELLDKEHIIPAWVKPLLKARGGLKRGSGAINENLQCAS